MSASLFIFLALALLAVVAAGGVVFSKSAIRSALFLVVNFFAIAFLYFTLNAEMLGIIQIVVYTGAIMVLFLFVIMLLNLGASQLLTEESDFKWWVGLPLGFLMIYVVSRYVLGPLQSLDIPEANAAYGAPQSVGRALFSSYVWPFEMVSVLLLIGVVGSILLAKRRID